VDRISDQHRAHDLESVDGRARFIFCHGGGVLPILLGRFAGFSGWNAVGPERLATLFPDGVYAEFAKLYFECAQAYAPETIAMLRALLPPSHLLFGTDFSYFPISHSVELFGKLDLPPDVRALIAGGNAAALLAHRHA
jgi:predicted TIM-barrel fold metal-dependent hydrolase